MPPPPPLWFVDFFFHRFFSAVGFGRCRFSAAASFDSAGEDHGVVLLVLKPSACSGLLLPFFEGKSSEGGKIYDPALVLIGAKVFGPEF